MTIMVIKYTCFIIDLLNCDFILSNICKMTMKKNKYTYIYIYINTHTHTVVAKMIRTLVSSAAKNGFKSVISIFCCSVSVGNISLHFQTFILPLIVIIQWDFCLKQPVLHTEIWSDHHQSVWSDMKKQRQNKSRRTVENNVFKMLQENYLQSYRTVKSFRHLCKNAVKWGCCQK